MTSNTDIQIQLELARRVQKDPSNRANVLAYREAFAAASNNPPMSGRPRTQAEKDAHIRAMIAKGAASKGE
jgi:hypothetical protein